MRSFAFFSLALILSALCAADSGTENLLTMCNALFNRNAMNASGAENLSGYNISANMSYSLQFLSAKGQLGEANLSVARLKAEGYPYLRANDLYMVAHQWLLGQSALEEAGEMGDYRFIAEKASEIRQIERDTFKVGDDLRALSDRLEKALPDADLTEARAHYAEARKEFMANRFEEAQLQADQSYESAAKAEADATRSKTLLESARKNIEVFLQENWQKIAVAAAAIAAFLFIFQKHIRRFIVNSRINSLVAERGVLESMMKKLQKDYYEDGRVNEMSFHIKTKKFAEMVRNINRQIPTLREELKRI